MLTLERPDLEESVGKVNQKRTILAVRLRLRGFLDILLGEQRYRLATNRTALIEGILEGARWKNTEMVQKLDKFVQRNRMDIYSNQGNIVHYLLDRW